MFLYRGIVGASILLVSFIDGSPLQSGETQGNHSSITLDISHQAKHLQGNKRFKEIERKARDVEAECRNTLGQRTICYWSYQTDVNVTREPAVIQKAVCSQVRVFLGTRMVTCETLYAQMIFRRANCIGDDCYMYQSVPKE
ncbi:hypothetical protein CHS0354_012901 [Potamilus streckersoni]|uniref:Uncharacterized protein n=1 Tax=Potamilus streckersoni TaxID=2493646 RepID=A0AAE0TAB8_9BIVA|nr:hypothetical protein CHS0354_012901 [Potamilus streckersoni]